MMETVSAGVGGAAQGYSMASSAGMYGSGGAAGGSSISNAGRGNKGTITFT